jgi:hypothetical protein
MQKETDIARFGLNKLLITPDSSAPFLPTKPLHPPNRTKLLRIIGTMLLALFGRLGVQTPSSIYHLTNIWTPSLVLTQANES